MIEDRPRSFYGRLSCLFLTFLTIGSLAACSGSSGGSAGGQQESPTLTVFAASSLTDAFVELEDMFEEQNTGVDVSTSFAGSTELLAQIQQGAPADVFASSAEAKMDTAMEEGLVGEPEIFARNRPVMIVSAADLAGIAEFRDLAEADAQMVLTEEAVPIARYAEEVLDKADGQYGENSLRGSATRWFPERPTYVLRPTGSLWARPMPPSSTRATLPRT